MITITKLGTQISEQPHGLEALRIKFNQNHCILLPQLFDQQILNLIKKRVQPSSFRERNHVGIGVELCLDDIVAVNTLNLLMNNQRFFDFIQKVTNCSPIGNFSGRVYRFNPATEHHDSWHDDLVKDRIISISVNLSEQPYSGGILQIRERQSEKIIHEVANLGFGDAIVFRISQHLQHRVTNVTGDYPKTAYAGWFSTQPDFRTFLKQLPKKLE